LLLIYDLSLILKIGFDDIEKNCILKNCIKCDQVKCFNYCINHKMYQSLSEKVKKSFLREIVGNRAIQCLELCYSLEYPFDEDLILSVRSLPCLIYLVDIFDKDCIIPYSVFESAVIFSKIEILEYLFSRKRLWCNFVEDEVSKKLYLQIVKFKFVDGLKLLLDNNIFFNKFLLLETIKSNSFEMFKLLYNKCNENNYNYLLDENMTFYAVQCSEFNFFKYLIENNCPYNENTINEIISKDLIYYLEYLYKMGLKLTKTMLSNSLKTMDSPYYTDRCRQVSPLCLNFLIKNGCCIDEDAGIIACLNQNVEALKLLIKHHVPLTSKTLQGAARSGSIECYNLLKENNCPDNHLCLTIAIENNKYSFVVFLVEIKKVEIDSNSINTASLHSKRYFKYLEKMMDFRKKFFKDDDVEDNNYKADY